MDHSHISDEDLAAAKMETTIFGDKESNVQIAQKIIDQNVVSAAMSLVQLARHAPDTRIRLAAAKEVLKLGMNTEGGGPAGALEKFLKSLGN